MFSKINGENQLNLVEQFVVNICRFANIKLHVMERNETKGNKVKIIRVKKHLDRATQHRVTGSRVRWTRFRRMFEGES